MSMSIGSNCVNQAEFGRDSKFWIFLNETRLEELRKAVAQNFQSCTFNRSVTSPFRNVSTYERRPALQFSMSPKSFLADRLAIYQNGPLGAKMKWLEQRNPDFRARPGKSRTGAESLVRLISLNFFGF